MMHHQKTGARAIYRQQEGQRIQESVTLADKFRKLKSLKVTLAFFGPEGISKSSEIKYSVNLSNAKSVFRFNCQNNECIRGDFDLSEELARAVAARRKLITGELCCQGWRDKTSINTLACRNILRYKLNLTF